MKVTNQIRSKVMKAAWTIWNKKEVETWSEALTRAWKWAKKNIINKVQATHVYLIAEEIKSSAKAILLNCDYRNYWVPKSIVQETIEGGFIVPMWWANKNLHTFGIHAQPMAL